MSDEIINGESTELSPLPVDVNDDITEYITDSSFEALKKRFGVADEDQSIRDEDFNPLEQGKASKKSEDEARIMPSFKKDVLDKATSVPMQSEFGTAESRFDNDAISFDEINIDLDSLGSLVNENDSVEVDRSTEFSTNTRVVYLDESADDGIKRNTDLEVSSVFKPD